MYEGAPRTCFYLCLYLGSPATWAELVGEEFGWRVSVWSIFG